MVENDIKPTYQRLAILDYLINNLTHPTVDEIYNSLITEVPTLSKTTVYNTVKNFVNKGILKQLSIDNNEVRYDIILEAHGHFRCDVCGKIYNFKIDKKNQYQDLDGFQINSSDIYLNGICKECLEKNKTK